MGKDNVVDDDTISVFLRRNDGKESTVLLKKGSTVDDLFHKVHLKVGIPMEEFGLVFTKYELKRGEGKTLKDYNIQDLSTVVMVMQVLGGSGNQETPFRAKTLTPLPGYIVLTKVEPDMITLECDVETPRAKMPCGHVISQASMTIYCRSLLDAGKFTFMCAYRGENDDVRGKGCEKEWEYFLVRHVACLSPDEQKYFETKLTKNYFERNPAIRQCPGCNSYCKRKNNSNQRVVCSLCSKGKPAKYEFCWDCEKEWGSKDHKTCALEYSLKYLKLCPTKAIGRVPNCLTMRACPKCSTLIEHRGGCKHMDCPQCSTSFCFICLEQKVGGKYKCGSWNDECVVAPVQTTFPEYNIS